LNRGYAKGGRTGFKDAKLVRGPTVRDKEKVVVDPGKRKSFISSPKWRELHEDRSKREKLKKLAEKKGIDPNETFGGRRVQKKGGPELIPPKRKDDVGVGGYQVPEKDLPSRSNMSKKLRGLKDGGRIGFKKGTDKRWMQKVSASIKKRGTKGKCTPITKPGCTGRAKALAKTFKKIAAKRKA